MCDEQVVAFLNQLADKVEYYRLVMEAAVQPGNRPLMALESTGYHGAAPDDVAVSLEEACRS